MADSVESAPRPAIDDEEREARRRRAQTGEAERGLWQRTSFQRGLIEGAAIFALWRLLELAPIGFWPGALFPFVLLGLLVLRFLPPVWASLRVIATRREKMSRRFFGLAIRLALICTAIDALVALAIGEAAQPFGGPAYGPDIARFFAHGPHAHPLGVGAFLLTELLTAGFLIAYFLIATICTRLAQGGFLRFTMPSGDGRVTL
jgi:hypothetical protein